MITPEIATLSAANDDQTARAYRAIRRMILDGGLPPGHRTSHRNLAEQLGLGRSPVRDAIMQLEAEGLVVQRGQKGIMLRELTLQEFSELYELRLVMEPFFAERAAILASPVQVAAIVDSCDQLEAIAARPDCAAWMADDANRRRVYRLDMQLHTTILAAAGNAVAARIFSSAHIPAHVIAWACVHADGPSAMDRLLASAGEHRAISDAVRARDPAAARERMRQHLFNAIPVVTAQYARALNKESDTAEQAAAKKAAAAVRRRKSS